MDSLISHSGATKLRPSARIINLIGEGLISDEAVAVVELVKNAYDADARQVRIRFMGENAECPEQIIIQDDGCGMDLDTVLNAWFMPGTMFKERNKFSPGGRAYQGSKGIGRFAAARLANVLILESKPPGAEVGVVATIDWTRFQSDSYLDEIELHYEERPIDDLPWGTRLTLRGIPEGKIWSLANYEDMHSRLARLVSPLTELNDFDIMLDVAGYPQFGGKVSPPNILSRPKYKLAGRVTEDGRFAGTVEIKGRDAVPLDQVVLGVGETPLCGPFDVEIRAWELHELHEYEQEGEGPVSQLTNDIQAYSGISIYRDGFRVYPYGQRGNDWAHLDSRRLKNTNRLMGNGQVVGVIQIAHAHNPELVDRSNREGMILNEAHQALEQWFVGVLSLLEAERARYIKSRTKEHAKRTMPLFHAMRESAETVSAASQAVSESLPDQSKILDEAAKQIQGNAAELENIINMLVLTAGLGHLVDIALHEMDEPVNRIFSNAATLRNLAEQQPSAQPMIEPIATIERAAEQLYNLKQGLDSQSPDKREKIATFDVLHEIRQVLKAFQSTCEASRIDLVTTGEYKPLMVTMSSGVLSHVVSNLVENAIYWVNYGKSKGAPGRIEVHLQQEEDGFAVTVSDSGPGVPEADRADIFEPYVTAKANGRGLGLYIARTIMEPYGTLEYREYGPMRGACFEARFIQNLQASGWLQGIGNFQQFWTKVLQKTTRPY